MIGRRQKLAAGLGLAVLAMVAWPLAALADSISPTTFVGSGPTGATYTINKQVTISEGACITCRADVLFLADNTGSMGTAIANVKASASTILSSTPGDIAWGVAAYKDVGDDFEYALLQDITTSHSDVTTAINAWVASGGGDQEESGLQGLRKATEATWRPGAARVVVWFGDNASHDPAGTLAPGPTSEAAATAALTGAAVKVEAVSVTTGSFGPGLDTCPAGSLDCTNGQATRIAAATGGTAFAGIDNAGVVAAILAAISASFEHYTSVCLATDGGNAGVVGYSSAPDCYVGHFDRSINREFGFTVTLRDLVPGDHTFHINALVDGGIVATETDRIISLRVPEPGSLLLLVGGILGLAAASRRRRG